MHEYHVETAGSALEEATHAIIALHGRGASARDILGLAAQFASAHTHMVAPQASHHTWYPYGFMAPEDSNQPWLESAVDLVKRLVGEVTTKVPLQNVYLMGFSQGACLTLEIAGRMTGRWAGVAAFTGGLIGEKLVRERYSGDFEGTPIFIGNSDKDPHVPQQRSEESAEILRNLGAQVSLNIYPGMPHTITMEELAAVKALMF
jgi:phospholipase/carboxylesterase